uniref:Copper transport protein n=1 Tax=Trichogramma kaykai TaxID=54128 RepID=A0ABD2XRG3_9HYME
MSHLDHTGHQAGGMADHSMHGGMHGGMDHSQPMMPQFNSTLMQAIGGAIVATTTPMTMMNHEGHHGAGHDAHAGHAGHDAAGLHEQSMCSGSSGHMHGMSMAFHGGYCETILFEGWKISSLGGLIGSIIGIVIMAALYEGLKYYREYLFWKTYNSLQYRSVAGPPSEKSVGPGSGSNVANGSNGSATAAVLEDNRLARLHARRGRAQAAIKFATANRSQAHPSLSLFLSIPRPTMLSWMHAFQTSLHIVQIILSYFLMLIFMTYNSWLCAAVVVGAAIGYFLFGWKKSVIVDVTEHCH